MRLSALGNDEEEDGKLAVFGALRRQRGCTGGIEQLRTFAGNLALSIRY
jgi:hypothetical protein